MALQHLTEEQIRTWTRIENDEWWCRHVFRGDMPPLTLRSGLTGFRLGGVLAATALYIGGKTGMGIGVGLTLVILRPLPHAQQRRTDLRPGAEGHRQRHPQRADRLNSAGAGSPQGG